MGLIPFTTAAAALAVLLPTAPAEQTSQGALLAQASPFQSAQSRAVQPGGGYMTTADGCTYRRTQAPGYAPRWILVRNPHHLGVQRTRGKCKGSL